MDNERFALDKPKFVIAIIGGQSIGKRNLAIGIAIHLAMEARIKHIDLASCYQPPGSPDLIIMDEMMIEARRPGHTICCLDGLVKSIPWQCPEPVTSKVFNRNRGKRRGRGSWQDYDHKGRRR
jgi:hypothetical protein